VKYAKNHPNGALQAGPFYVYMHSKAADAFSDLIDPSNIAQTKFTIREGATVRYTVEQLVKQTQISQDDFESALADASLLPPEADGEFEGWLFPSSYELDYDVTAKDVLRAMIEETKSTLTDLGVAQADWEIVLNKASIVQDEVIEQDMPKAAAVLENRLAIDMPLGVDSSVAYGVCKREGRCEYGTELLQSDLDDASNPYNLRILLGLPPTPTSNPGEAAIKAVLNPAEGDWLYFVTVNLDTGETVFAETEEEFEVAKSQYKQYCVENPDKC
jgi:UPF0755 protein